MKTDRRLADEAGFALPGAMLAMIVLMSLAMLFMATAVAETGATENQRQYQSALPAAEAAAETLLARYVEDSDYSSDSGGTTYPWTNPPDEKAWVTDVDARNPDLIDVPGGQAYSLGPFTDAGKTFLYGVGIVDEEVRAVRVDLGTADFEIDAALLVRGDLSIKGGGGPDGHHVVDGNVHANGNVSVEGGGDIKNGTLTASGNCSPCPVEWMSGAPEAPKSDFAFSARDLYHQRVNYPDPETPSEWYDLCSDGTVRLPPTPAAPTDVPCQGDVLTNLDLGWEYKDKEKVKGKSEGKAWHATKFHAPAVYYVHKSDAVIDNSNVGTVTTVVVEKDPESSAGSLTVKGSDGYQPLLGRVLFLAERDVIVEGNFSSASFGAVLAGEQVWMGGGFDLRGGVIARSDAPDPLPDNSPIDPEADGCASMGSSGMCGGASITYTEGMDLPFPGPTALDTWREL